MQLIVAQQLIHAQLFITMTTNTMISNDLYQASFDRSRHGGLYDRGAADSYYGRSREPHWYPEGTYEGSRIEQLTPQQVEEYEAGYDWNELHGDKKNWGEFGD